MSDDLMAVVRISCEGQRFEAVLEECPGFDERAGDSFFRALQPGSPTSDFFPRDEDGAFLIQGLEASAFERVWLYLKTGTKPSLTSAAEVASWQRVVDLLCIRGALLPWSPAIAVLTTGGFIAHPTLDPQRLVVTEPLLHLADCLPYSGLNSQAVSVPGGEPDCMISSPIADVKICSKRGLVLLRRCGPNSSIGWQAVHASTRVRGNVLIAALVRRYARTNPEELGFILFLHLAPRRHCYRSQSRPEIAQSPAFWLILRFGEGDGFQLSLLHDRCSPGWLAQLHGGGVMVMQHPESLRKAQLLIFTVVEPGNCATKVDNLSSKPELWLQAPGFLANVRALQPYNPCYTSGFGKGGPKGLHKSKGHARPPGIKFEKRSVDTVHPMGRAMRDLWVVESQQQLVIVVHAIDGRVCVGQLSGVQGVIPEPRAPGADKNAPQVWDIWPRPCHSRHDAIHGLLPESSKRRHNVPMCDEIVAVLPRQEEILVLYRNRCAKSRACLAWRIQKPQRSDSPQVSASSPANFFCCSNANGKGLGRTKTSGSWSSDRWGSQSSPLLPDTFVDPRWPVILEADMELPEKPTSANDTVEVLRWAVQHPPSCPVVHSWTRGLYVSDYGMNGIIYTGKGLDGKGRPSAPRLTIGPAGSDGNQDSNFRLGSMAFARAPSTMHVLASRLPDFGEQILESQTKQ
eukprot:TRINITY_DN51488_c0_g1_i1.p1 TRINITY_DN51488_c0_g1~~TRINITY_DN51488_c0_g1_i1.p1  ORF type:complete len:685 (-),score=72.97 TRINITY_DN51488_c0_g1_i1:104-2158(-)